MIDTSALLAILFREPEWERFTRMIVADSVRLVSAVSAFEAAMVAEARKGPSGGLELDLLLHRLHVEIVAFDSRQVELARSAWRLHGKGNAPAALSFGDCCSYALARASRQPLLFKGDDFGRTDIDTVA